MCSGTRLYSGEYYQTRGITGRVGKHFSVVSMRVTSTKNLERKNCMNMLLANKDIHSSFDRLSLHGQSLRQKISGGGWTIPNGLALVVSRIRRVSHLPQTLKKYWLLGGAN